MIVSFHLPVIGLEISMDLFQWDFYNVFSLSPKRNASFMDDVVFDYYIVASILSSSLPLRIKPPCREGQNQEKCREEIQNLDVHLNSACGLFYLLLRGALSLLMV